MFHLVAILEQRLYLFLSLFMHIDKVRCIEFSNNERIAKMLPVLGFEDGATVGKCVGCVVGSKVGYEVGFVVGTSVG